METKYNYRMNIGGASIILILLVIALTIFASLSIRTSYHEFKLSEKTRDSIVEYYIADSKAEELLSLIITAVNSTKSSAAYNEADLEKTLKNVEGITNINYSEGIINYEIKVNEVSSLKVELHIDLSTTNPRFTIYSWNYSPTVQTGYEEENIELWDGTINE